MLGFYIIDVSGLDEGLQFARELAAANPGGAYELRPIHLYIPGAPVANVYASDREYAGDTVPCEVTDQAWIEASLVSARPQAVAALLRYFRDLDTAEEAFQEACLRALKNWTANGPPRDATAWLIMVGRNAALDQKRKTSRLTAMPDEAQVSDLEDVETPIAERLDERQYRDDVLRLMFICCHPDLAGDAADTAGAAHRVRA